MKDSWIVTEVFEIKRQTPSFFSVKLMPVDDDVQFHFQAGQCVNVLTPTEKKSCFSIANEPEEEKFIELFLKDQITGAAHEICHMKVGDRLKISPPFGKGFPIERFKTNDLLLIGIGSGFSPLRSLLKSLLRWDHQFKEITFVYGARNQAEIPFKDEFDLWAKKIKIQIALSQPTESWNGFTGRVTDLISKMKLDSEAMIFCICGHREMEEQVRNLLETKGISKQNILLNY